MSIKKIKNVSAYVATIVMLLIILFPIIYIFISSFKPLIELIKSGTGFFPREPTLSNYTTLLISTGPTRNFPLFLFNSLKVSLGTALATIVFASFGGYGLARYNYPGRDIIAQSMLFIYVFPTVLLIIPLYRMFQYFNLLDTHLGLIIIYTTLAAPFCTWLLTSFFKAIPIEMEEAAAVDGANKLNIFIRIIFPLAAPGIVTVGVYAFVVAWSEYMFASIILSSNANRTAPLGLALLTAEQYVEWGPLLAGSVLIILPVIILFIPVAKQFIKGFMAGALKQ